MERTESGLLVPDGTVAATTPPETATVAREVWPNDDARTFQRAMRFVLSRGLDIMFVCKACHAAERHALLNDAISQKTGEHVLLCQCKARVLTGIYAAPQTNNTTPVPVLSTPTETGNG